MSFWDLFKPKTAQTLPTRYNRFAKQVSQYINNSDNYLVLTGLFLASTDTQKQSVTVGDDVQSTDSENFWNGTKGAATGAMTAMTRRKLVPPGGSVTFYSNDVQSATFMEFVECQSLDDAVAIL